MSISNPQIPIPLEIQEDVEREVRGHWDQTKTALLLSSLGLKLKNETRIPPSFLDMGLKNFVARLSNIQIITHPKIPQKIGVVPADATLPSDHAEVFRSSPPPSVQRRHLIPAFWGAFQTPLHGRRYVLIGDRTNPNVEIREVEDGQEVTNGYEIEKSDIVNLSDTPLTAPAQAIWTKIEAWVARYRLDLAIFEDQYVRISSGSALVRSSSSPSGLEAAFDKLSPDELARILVPLDLVIKLLKSG